MSKSGLRYIIRVAPKVKPVDKPSKQELVDTWEHLGKYGCFNS